MQAVVLPEPVQGGEPLAAGGRGARVRPLAAVQPHVVAQAHAREPDTIDTKKARFQVRLEGPTFMLDLFRTTFESLHCVGEPKLVKL